MPFFVATLENQNSHFNDAQLKIKLYDDLFQCQSKVLGTFSSLILKRMVHN